MAIGPLSILVNDQPYSGGVIDVVGDGIAFAKITIVAPGQPNTAWKINTLDGFMPFDKANGTTDANSKADVYLGPTRLKGDADFKVTVGPRNATYPVRFSGQSS